jgi:hypothetical protein
MVLNGFYGMTTKKDSYGMTKRSTKDSYGMTKTKDHGRRDLDKGRINELF